MVGERSGEKPDCFGEYEERDSGCQECESKVDCKKILFTPPLPLPRKFLILYLLPLIFGLIGGILGYFILKKRDKTTALHMLGLGMSVWIVPAVLILFNSMLFEVELNPVIYYLCGVGFYYALTLQSRKKSVINKKWMR